MERRKGENFVYECECGEKPIIWCALVPYEVCGKCGRTRKCRNAPKEPLRYVKESSHTIIFTRRKIRSGAKRRRAVWQVILDEKRRRNVYLTCPACTKIVNVTGHLGNLPVVSGYLSHCVVCPHCEAHFWAYLEGWKSIRNGAER